MIYVTDDLIEVQHLGLGQYAGTKFRSIIDPHRIQLIRTKGPTIRLKGDDALKHVFQVIYSNRGYTESLVIESYEYIQLLIFLALGKRGYDWFMANPDDHHVNDYVNRALSKSTVNPEDGPSPRILIWYIKQKLDKEDRESKED